MLLTLLFVRSYAHILVQLTVNMSFSLHWNGLSMIFLLKRYNSAAGLMEARVCRGVRTHSSRSTSTSPAWAHFDWRSKGSGTDTVTEQSLKKKNVGQWNNESLISEDCVRWSFKVNNNVTFESISEDRWSSKVNYQSYVVNLLKGLGWAIRSTTYTWAQQNSKCYCSFWH